MFGITLGKIYAWCFYSEMIFIQSFYDNYWDNPLSHTLIMSLLSLSITLVLVPIHALFSIFLVVSYVVHKVVLQIAYLFFKRYIV